MNFNTINLNPLQKQAVEYFDSPLLIIAGAGSGKTMVLTYKIAYMLKNGLFSSNNVLAITFTNKSAKEMQTRVANLVPEFHTQPFISTFHAFCAYFLRREFEVLNEMTVFFGAVSPSEWVTRSGPSTRGTAPNL